MKCALQPMVIHPLDNVEIHEDGHKYARRAIRAGENVVKYGMPIGHATCDIAPGEHVHVHNVATNLGEALEYEYAPDPEVVGGVPCLGVVHGMASGKTGPFLPHLYALDFF